MDVDFNKRDITYLIIMLVVLVGSFAIMLTGEVLPNWLVGTISSLITGVLGIQVGNTNE